MRYEPLGREAIEGGLAQHLGQGIDITGWEQNARFAIYDGFEASARSRRHHRPP